jgi:hypothetical protein
MSFTSSPIIGSVTPIIVPEGGATKLRTRVILRHTRLAGYVEGTCVSHNSSTDGTNLEFRRLSPQLFIDFIPPLKILDITPCPVLLSVSVARPRGEPAQPKDRELLT